MAQDRVTIARGQAALVPIVSRPVKGRRVIYYKASFSPRPVDAWVLRNDTDLTFEAGAKMRALEEELARKIREFTGE